jgi:hypothetical protein
MLWHHRHIAGDPANRKESTMNANKPAAPLFAARNAVAVTVKSGVRAGARGKEAENKRS